jgi:hypothetical protein
MEPKQVRIAGVQGFYGDSPMGALAVAMAGAADYLVHDALAELTLSILQKDRQRHPDAGYARDLDILAQHVMPIAFAKGMKIVASSGGLNPAGAARKVAGILRSKGLTQIRIACITGDDVRDRIPELIAAGEPLANLDTGEPLDPDACPITHANVYTGAASVARALDQGADLVLAGRIADPCLTLGILAHEFGWDLGPEGLSQAGLDRLGSGILIGHLLECGGQASGGNSYAEWPMPYPVSNLGYPIASVSPDGSAIFSILDGQGGRMSRNTLREQLLYEIHDPAAYLTPDVTADFTSVTMEDLAPNRVRVQGARGRPRPERLKLTLGRMEGYLTDQFFFFSWPYAYEKAQKFIQAAREIWKRLPIRLDRAEFSLIGIDAMHGAAAPMPDAAWLAELNEIGVRIALQHRDERAGKTALQAITCLALNGPPGLVSVPGWGHTAREQLSLWPALIPRSFVQEHIGWISTADPQPAAGS